MRLPIDTSRLQLIVVAEAEPLKKFEDGKPRESWAPRLDENGEMLWRVQVVAMGDGEADIVRVVVPGDPGVRAAAPTPAPAGRRRPSVRGPVVEAELLPVRPRMAA